MVESTNENKELTELEKAELIVNSLTPLQKKKLASYINKMNNKAKFEANKKEKRRKRNKIAKESRKKNR